MSVRVGVGLRIISLSRMCRRRGDPGNSTSLLTKDHPYSVHHHLKTKRGVVDWLCLNTGPISDLMTGVLSCDFGDSGPMVQGMY